MELETPTRLLSNLIEVDELRATQREERREREK